MRLIDLSQPITDRGPNCPVHPPIDLKLIASHAAGDDWHMELIRVATHTGSHVDAPLHRIAGGASISDWPLERWVGRAYIADLRGSEPDREIGSALLAQALAHADALEDAIVLIATGYGHQRAADDNWYHHSPHVTPEGAAWLVQQNIRAVGIDHYSVGGGGPTNAHTHKILLERGVWIVEELFFPDAVWSLRQPCRFWSLPVNIQGASGAFCRPVIAVEDQ